MTLAAFLVAPLDASSDESDLQPFRADTPRADAQRASSSSVSIHVYDDDAADLALANQIRAGDERSARTAFDTLYSRFFTPLWRFARQMVHADSAAQDVVQDVFVTLWTRRSEWIVTGAVRTYLYRAVHNRALNMVRDGKGKRSVDAEMVADTLVERSPSVSAHVEAHDLETALQRAVDALPERQRTALLLFWHEAMNMSEVARVLGITPAAARKLLLTAQASLRRVVAAYL